MKAPVILALLLLPCTAFAADQCLIVYPMTTNLAGQPGSVAALLSRQSRFYYAGSEGLPMSDVKHKYSKKDLQKLEKAGVKIVLVPDRAVTQDAATVTDACRNNHDLSDSDTKSQ